MSYSPSAALVAHVQQLILETFHVSDAEARERATGLVLLAEGWGTPESAASLNWLYRVRKSFGKTLEWRSEKVRAEFEEMQQQKVEAYELLINQKRPGGQMPI